MSTKLRGGCSSPYQYVAMGICSRTQFKVLNGGQKLARGATVASTRLLFSGPHGYEPLFIGFTAFTLYKCFVESNLIFIIKNSRVP